MATLQDIITITSSVGLRIAAYVFLRWIPGHVFPPIVNTLFGVYLLSFVASFLTQPQYEIVEDDVEVTITETEVEDQPPTNPSTAAHSHNLRSDDKPTNIKKKVEIDETIIAVERSDKPWKTLLTGLPSPTSNLLSLATFAINTLLVLAVTDYVYSPKTFHAAKDLSFARIGYVSPTEANLLVREPNATHLPIFVSYRVAEQAEVYEDSAWQAAGTIASLGNDTDFTAAITFPIPNLPDRKYQWTTSNNHTGFFTIPPKPGQVSKSGTFTFLTSSCLKPRFPYTPWNHALSIPGLKYMASILESIPGIQFMLFLGDFIYIDVPKRFGAAVEDYRREYRQVYASPDWPSVGQNLSWIHVLDDHEIANDWDMNTTGVYEAAVEPYNLYHTSVNPPKARKAKTYNTVRDDATWFEFTQGPATFFMMDTRTYRDASNILPLNSTEKTMLGSDQLEDLLAFLRKPVTKGVKWKFVISSVPFTKNWGTTWGIDTWAGYLHERRIILEAMWDVGSRGGVGVVVLSGDRHEFAATKFPPPVGGKWPISATVSEFSTSPLSQFYLPFHTYEQRDEEDVVVKYIPAGNSKIGAITIENPKHNDQSILTFKLFVNGEETWSNVLLSPPESSGTKRAKDALWG